MKLSVLCRLTIVVLSVLASPAALADGKEMPGGLWEITNKMEMPGMPAEMAAKMGNMTVKHCVKPGERKWTEQRNPHERGDRKCEPPETKTDGNKVSWHMKCADGATVDGTVTHNGKDAYTMDMTMSSKRGNMKMHSEGKKIADTCEKK
ncbi:MAG: DUF3617 family protein [Pseudomonadota bacterium]